MLINRAASVDWKFKVCFEVLTLQRKVRTKLLGDNYDKYQYFTTVFDNSKLMTDNGRFTGTITTNNYNSQLPDICQVKYHIVRQ